LSRLVSQLTSPAIAADAQQAHASSSPAHLRIDRIANNLCLRRNRGVDGSDATHGYRRIDRTDCDAGANLRLLGRRAAGTTCTTGISSAGGTTGGNPAAAASNLLASCLLGGVRKV